MALLFGKHTLPSHIDKQEHQECFLLLQDINLIEDLLAYDYTYFAMVYPSVTEARYKLLQKIVKGSYNGLKLVFLKYLYHDYKKGVDGYEDIFSGCRYEKLKTNTTNVSWRSCDKSDFTLSTVLYSFRGKDIDSCDVVTYIGDSESLSSNTCLARENLILNKNFI